MATCPCHLESHSNRHFRPITMHSRKAEKLVILHVVVFQKAEVIAVMRQPFL